MVTNMSLEKVYVVVCTAKLVSMSVREALCKTHERTQAIIVLPESHILHKKVLCSNPMVKSPIYLSLKYESIDYLL